MHSITLADPADFAGWRRAARALLAGDVPPEHVQWLVTGESGSLFDETAKPAAQAIAPTFTVPRAFVMYASMAALHSDPQRFALLYRLLWRVRQEPGLMRLSLDRDVAHVRSLAKAVARDIHKMKAFVRFRRAPNDVAASHVAWFEPQHYIVARVAPFFARRFSNFTWAILTPRGSAYWDGAQLSFGSAGQRTDAPAHDDQESLWQTYYASTFNPARVNPRLMRSHMPLKYWRNLPESALIDDLIASAQPRTDAMITRASGPIARGRSAARAALRRSPEPASARSPAPTDTLDAVREAAAHCRDCPLWKNATQTVFGEGAHGARVMFVGEQPGDQEDLAGKPFVGPAGKLLDRALQEAGVDRGTVYVTNAVKHFKFEPRGKRRIHKKPNEAEIAACHQWYERELAAIQPDLVVALGATAARAVFGRATAVEKNRGRVLEGVMSHDVLVTVHPSFLLRVPPEDKPAAYAKFVADLKLVASYTARSKRARPRAS